MSLGYQQPHICAERLRPGDGLSESAGALFEVARDLLKLVGVFGQLAEDILIGGPVRETSGALRFRTLCPRLMEEDDGA